MDKESKDKHTVYHSSKKLLIAKDGGYCGVPQLVRPRKYTSEKCPILGDTSMVEPLLLGLLEHSEMTDAGKNESISNSHR